MKFKNILLKLKAPKGLKLKMALAVAILVIFFLAVTAAIYVGMNKYNPNDNTKISIATSDAITFEVPAGAGTSYIGELLKNKGIISNSGIFTLIAKATGYEGKFKSGEHIISKKLSIPEIMKILSQKASASTFMITFPENFTYKQTVDKLVKEGVINKAKFEKAAREGDFDYEFLKKIPDRTHRLEGYLFPETYNFGKNMSEKKVIKVFLDQFNKIFKQEYYDRAEALGMSVDEVITMASIIEREAKRSDERALIAGVFYNRLKSDIAYLHKLQSCASIQYILAERGTPHETITLEDEKIDDPYNTYMYEGLPPGPICSPGEASIIAALYPEASEYLYFVTKNDGSDGHYFSKTYDEHLAAIQKANTN